MAQVYFTADTHFSHELVARIRGFQSTEEHDEDVVDTWNSMVTKRDIVWHLGDLTLKNPPAISHLLDRLVGTIHLVLGNHDRAHPVFKRHQNAFKHYGRFESVGTMARTRLGDQAVLMSHFPFTGEGARDQPDRYEWARLRDVGVPLIHGHTHDADQRFTHSPAGTPMLHVGWDAWGRPVHRDELVELLKED